jgi:hypothetical protein
VPPDTVLAAANVLLAQGMLEPQTAISLPTLEKEPLDTLGQQSVLLTTRPLGFLALIIKAAATDFHQLAQVLERVAILGAQLGNYLISLHDSWPKMVKAFFKISRSVRTASNSRRNRVFSCSKSLSALADALWP